MSQYDCERAAKEQDAAEEMIRMRHLGAALAAAPKPDRPTPPPPSSARPENGGETMADALKAIAALRNEWDGGTLGDAVQAIHTVLSTLGDAVHAIHTVLSTLVAEREARARRDEAIRTAAKAVETAAKKDRPPWANELLRVLSALAAALGEDGR